MSNECMSLPPVESLPWAPWAEEALKDLARLNPRCIMVSAILSEEEVYNCYWGCDAGDKIQMAGRINIDATMDALRVNGYLTNKEIEETENDFAAWDEQFEDSGE